MASVVTTQNTSFSSPRTWVTGETVTATLMNDEIRDNIGALKSPAHGYCNLDEATDYTTTSTSFGDVDSTDLSMTLTTAGGKLLCWFTGTVTLGVNRVAFNVSVDGTNQFADDGIIVAGSQLTGGVPITFIVILENVSAASHVFRLRWKVTAAATATMYAGAGTSGLDIHPQFGVLELA